MTPTKQMGIKTNRRGAQSVMIGMQNVLKITSMKYS
jgi:hypothetical protein